MTDYAADFDQIAGNRAAAPRDYASDFDALSTEAPRAVAPKAPEAKQAGMQMPPALELVSNIAGNLGGAITSGWHGLYKLAEKGVGSRGANIDWEKELIQNVNPAVQGDQARVTQAFAPETAGGKAAVEAFQSGWNPLNWPSLAGKWAGEKAFEAGAGPGVATGIEVAANAAPLAFLRGGKAAPAAARGEPHPMGGEIPQPAVSSLVENAPASAPKVILNAAGGEPTSIRAPTFADIDPAESAVAANKALAPQQVTKRSEVLERIGLPKEVQRNSAVEGDLQGAADDYRSKLVSNTQGEFWREQFDKERGALANHAESIVQGTGGTVALDESARYGQGTRIVEPLEAVRKHFNDQIGSLYKAADERAGGAPIASLTALNDMLGTDSMFAGKVQNGSLRRGIRAYMREQGIVDKQGALQPVTVEQAEGLRQYINSQYAHETAGLAGKLKDAIDNDVTQAAGDDIYAQARAMRAARARIVDDPNGISSLLQADPNAPMNRAVPYEKIPDRITQMPVDQVSHIVQVLKSVPDELKPQAQQAISEIQASFANKALDLGSKRAPGEPWGANDVSKFLRDNKEKIAVVFKDRPDLMAQMQDLNDAGLILAPKTAYRGAPAEAHNLLQRGAVNLITPAATSAGAFLGGPTGAALGGYIGPKLAGKVSEKIALKNAQKRVGSTRLSDINPE